MTERCQTKFIEKNDNPNYIIYVGVLCTSLAVLYFYRFHFVTIAFSYGLGCVACYYGLNSSVLHNYLDKLKCHLISERSQEDVKDPPVKGCVACGLSNCPRHDGRETSEPWEGLHIHKQLDQAIEDFYNTILDQFINSWYSKITIQPFFVDELRQQLRYASACLIRRAVKVKYSHFIVSKAVPCALHHYTVCCGLPSLPGPLALHPAASSRRAELQYLRAIANAVLPYLLRSHDLENRVFHVLIREIFSGWVLLSLTDVLADPYILNTLILLATGKETMAQLPTTPNYKVEFLETFVRQSDSVYTQRCKLYMVDLDTVIGDQDHFYSFMQFMKTTNQLHLLQFYNDIKSFQTKILNPELSAEELSSLHQQACTIYDTYLAEHSTNKVPLHSALAEELQQLLATPDTVKRLQTSRALYEAARTSHAVLEKIMLPKFLHSEEFYKLIIGSRIPQGYQKQTGKRNQDRVFKIGNKVKSALKSQTLDGQILDNYANSEESEGDMVDNLDILKYLDSIAAEKTTSEQDLSTFKVVLTNVETRLQAPPRRGPVRVFTAAVHKAQAPGAPGSPGGPGARLWTVERSEHDFHLLRSKLHEFHGDRLLLDLHLPSRRDNSPLETLRYKYEDFLQRLLQKSLLQTSELLYIFLTVDSDFSTMVQASTLNANSTDLVNIYQTVTHRLRKEKGQHLETFLTSLLVSSDIERYQALKHGTTREVEEALEVSEDVEVEVPQKRQKRTRNIYNSIFENNFDVEPIVCELRDQKHQTTVVGFTQCIMYLLTKVVRGNGVLCAVLGSLLAPCRTLVDTVFDKFLHSTLVRLLPEPRLAHLIRLGQGMLFGKKSPMGRMDAAQHREMARARLRALGALGALGAAGRPLGAALPAAVAQAFDIIQSPQLNKQLVYNLLDLCIMELFPELGATDTPSNLPKS